MAYSANHEGNEETWPSTIGEQQRRLQSLQQQQWQQESREAPQNWRFKSSGRLRRVKEEDASQPHQVCQEVCQRHRTRVGGRRPSFQDQRAWSEDSLGQTENIAEVPLHAERDSRATAERKVGASFTPSGVVPEEHSLDCPGRWGLVGKLAADTTARSDQPYEVWRIARGVGARDCLPQSHVGARAPQREAAQRQQLGRQHWQWRSDRGRRQKVQEERQRERRQMGRGEDRKGRCVAEAMSSTNSAKSEFNSPVLELECSRGAFGRFLTLMHGKSNHDLGHRTSPSPETHDLFPSRLAVPASVAAVDCAKKRATRRGRARSWKWTQTLWCLFTFLEGGAPTSEKDQLALAQRAFSATWTEQHEALAGLLHTQSKQFVKLKCQEPLSRGTQKLDELIKKIRPYNSTYQSGGFSIDELINKASHVKPDRMSLPQEAGILDPRDFLKGDTLKAFETMHEWAPHNEPPCHPTKAVFKVLPQDRDQVYCKLLESGVACLLPVDQALTDDSGRIISGGLFAVPHKPLSDRIILDRRPQNELERRLVLAKLPHGSLLTQLIVPKGFSIRGSGDDLRNFFYLLKHSPEWLGRNCVGQPFDGRNFVKFGGKKGQRYMLAFRVIPMGDCNAVDLAQETHLQILKDGGTMQEGETIAFRQVVPANHTLEGLYIDDHLVMQVLPSRAGRGKASKFRDEVIVEKSRAQYKKLGVPVSEKKQFTNEYNFTAWGTNVDNQTGRVGVGLEKLKQLCSLVVEICQLKTVSQKLMQKTIGLLVHPAMHKRILMSLLLESYSFTAKMHPKKQCPLPRGVKEELLWMCLCLPVSRRIGASDASLGGGGRAACLTSGAVAHTLYRYSEHHGEHVRLDWQNGALAPPTKMRSAPNDLEDLMNAHCWTTTHKCKFNHRQHINILEMKMVKAELKGLVKESSDPQRAVLLVDSRVVVGAFSKGRSSSKNLNRLLRSMIGWMIAGQKSLHLIWVGTKANPADYPSRGQDIPNPAFRDPVLSAQLGFMPASDRDELQRRKSNREIQRQAAKSRNSSALDIDETKRQLDAEAEQLGHPAIGSWTFREIFAGKAHLTQAFRQSRQFQVDQPVELVQKGRRSVEHDILHEPTFKRLCAEAKRPRQLWHFGMPCGSFSILQGLNHGTKTSDKPQGTDSLEREIQGNEILRRTIILCYILVEHGSFFTIENPKSSYAWKMPAMKKLLEKTGSHVVHLDQCEYGLRIPSDKGSPVLARKSTTFAGNLPELSRLARACSHQHEHVQVIVSVKTSNGWERRSTLAGAYPRAMCQQYHRICLRMFA